MTHNLPIGEKKILGVKIDDISKDEAIHKISSWIGSSEKPKLVFTPGPEFLVTASKDEEFKKILNSSDLNVPEGMGLRFGGAVNRVPGIDFMTEICELASKKGWSVGLLGGREKDSGVREVSKLAAKKLLAKFPNLKIKFSYSDEEADKIVKHYFIDNTIAIPSDSVDVLFVGLGHPKQEKLLFNIVKENKGIKFKVGMGVGGSFDLIAGSKKRAPKIMTDIGLEWLWRGLQDPNHFVRIWRATGEFLLLLMMFNFRRN